MSGPYETEREASEAARQYAGDVPVVAAPMGRQAEVNRAMLLDAVIVAGLRLGEWDRTVLDRLASRDLAECVVVADLIARAADRAG